MLRRVPAWAASELMVLVVIVFLLSIPQAFLVFSVRQAPYVAALLFGAALLLLVFFFVCVAQS